MNLMLINAFAILMLRNFCHGVRSDQTLVNFREPKVRKLLESTVSVAKICAMESHASPTEVRAYFTNSEPSTKNGECFVACIYERSKFIKFDKINPSRMIELATQVNGPESRVVKSLKIVTEMCLMSIENINERCLRASSYNNCINSNMKEFAFPEDIADSIIAQIPFGWSDTDRFYTWSDYHQSTHPPHFKFLRQVKSSSCIMLSINTTCLCILLCCFINIQMLFTWPLP